MRKPQRGKKKEPNIRILRKLTFCKSIGRLPGECLTLKIFVILWWAYLSATSLKLNKEFGIKKK